MKKLILFFLVVLAYTTSIAQNNKVNNDNYSFIENKGQVADGQGKARPDILFITQKAGVNMYLTAKGIYYQWQKLTNYPTANPKKDFAAYAEQLKSTAREIYSIDVELVGANPAPAVEKIDPSDDHVNYYLNHCPNGVLGVKHFSKLVYKDVYPGIDWVWYNKEGQIKYDFVVNPGADYKQIKIKINGATNISLLENGGYKITTPLGELTEAAPETFVGNEKINSMFLIEGNTISFRVPDARNDRKMVIDPLLTWSTYYGGAEYDASYGVTTAPNGDVYICGNANSNTNIFFNGFLDKPTGYGGTYFAKFSALGKRLWATYYGTDKGASVAFAVSVNTAGHLYITGASRSDDSLSFQGHQNTNGGDYDAFLLKFDESGRRLWATFYGGTGYETGKYLATYGTNVFMAGETTSSNAMAYGVSTSYKGGTDGFLVEFDSSGKRLWGRYFGGSGKEEINGLSVTSLGEPILTGSTKSNSGITTSGVHQAGYGGGSSDAFLAVFQSFGTLKWATYYGGTSGEDGGGVAVDANNNIYMGGATSSLNGIATTGAYQINMVGNNDAFLVKFNSQGVRQWGTYFGGEQGEDIAALAADNQGNTYFTGNTASVTGIYLNGFLSQRRNDVTLYVSKFDNSGNKLWGTYFGDTLVDFVNSIACGPNGAIYITGEAESDKNIAYAGHQNIFGGLSDAFLTKFTEEEFMVPGKFFNLNVCGEKEFTYVNENGIGLFKCRWYEDSTSAIWFHEGDSMKRLFTKTDTLWASLSSDINNYIGKKIKVIVTIYPQPVAAFSAPATGCLGRKNQFTNNSTVPFGNLNYLWNFDNGVTATHKDMEYIFSFPATYHVKLKTYTDECSDEISKDILIHPTPPEPVLSGPASVPATSVQQYFSTFNDVTSTFSWLVTGGAQTGILDDDTAQVQWGSGTSGSIQVAEVNTFGCLSDYAKLSIIISGGNTGVEEPGKNSVRVYPNPAHTFITLYTGHTGSYTITDITGRTVLQGIKGGIITEDINIQHLAPGTYMLSFLSQGQDVYTERVIIY